MDPPSTPQLIWSKIDAVSGVPEARHSHCAAIVTLPDREPYMFVFGGVVGGDRTNSLLRFSTGNMFQCTLSHKGD